jgi:hypothetical protein
MADGDPLLAIWLWLEARRLDEFVSTVADALEGWSPTESLKSPA